MGSSGGSGLKKLAHERDTPSTTWGRVSPFLKPGDDERSTEDRPKLNVQKLAMLQEGEQAVHVRTAANQFDLGQTLAIEA